MSSSDRICRHRLQTPASDNLAHLSVRKFGKHGLADCRAIRGCAAANRTSPAHAALRLDLLHVKNLPLVENAKEHGLSKFVLQPVEIRPRTSPEIKPIDGSGS